MMVMSISLLRLAFIVYMIREYLWNDRIYSQDMSIALQQLNEHMYSMGLSELR